MDPVQHRLIPAHVTLCREDELDGIGIEEVRERIHRGRPAPITLRFGPPERFADHGILMPCLDGLAAFQALRCLVLATEEARAHAPHLTLAHPRNPKAPGNDLASADPLRAGVHMTFATVHLIEQRDAAPWDVLGTIPLPTSEPG